MKSTHAPPLPRTPGIRTASPQPTPHRRAVPTPAEPPQDMFCLGSRRLASHVSQILACNVYTHVCTVLIRRPSGLHTA